MSLQVGLFLNIMLVGSVLLPAVSLKLKGFGQAELTLVTLLPGITWTTFHWFPQQEHALWMFVYVGTCVCDFTREPSQFPVR